MENFTIILLTSMLAGVLSCLCIMLVLLYAQRKEDRELDYMLRKMGVSRG